MGNIWLTSDTHFNHQRNFILEPRGFNSIEKMNETIISNWNYMIKDDDIVYHLGDVIMGEDLQAGIDILKRLNGKKYLAYGNHDTNNRIEAFKKENLFEDIQMGYRLKAGKSTLLLTHYPTLTGNGEDKNKVFNLHGHTHQKTDFTQDFPLLYHVGVDSHNCFPVSLEVAIEEIKHYQIALKNMEDKNEG